MINVIKKNTSLFLLTAIYFGIKKDIIKTHCIQFRLKKNVSCVTQIVANKIFENNVTQKIIADLGIIQHFIANHNLIRNYYDNYLKYQVELIEVLPFYRKDTLLLSLNNSFLKLTNV